MTVDAEQLGRLAIAVGRISRRLRSGGGGELSLGLISALATIGKEGPIRLADLAARERISAPSATRIVAELEAQGLVTRTADPADGRAQLVAVSDAGQAMIVEARSARVALLAELLERIDPAARQAIADALPALEAVALVAWED